MRILQCSHEKTGLHDLSSRLVIWLTMLKTDTKADGRQPISARGAGSS